MPRRSKTKTAATKATTLQYACRFCSTPFQSKTKCAQHVRTTHPSCPACHKRFNTSEFLQSHQRKASHCFCRECNLYFSTSSTHLSHMRMVEHTTHYQCCDCGREYISQKSLDFHCCDCDRVLGSLRSLYRHFVIDDCHLPRVGVPRLYECEKCSKTFQDQTALRSHTLAKHKPPRHIPCPASGECKRKFATPSALLSHLESGRCRSGMTRERVNELALTHDVNGHTTAKAQPESVGYLAQKLDIRSCSGVVGGPNTERTSSLSSPAISPNLDAVGQPRSILNNPIGSPLIEDDDTVSEWQVLGGVPLTPAISEGPSEWSLVGATPLTPSVSGDASDWSLVSGLHTPAEESPSDISSNRKPPVISTFSKLRCPLCPPSGKTFRTFGSFQAHMASAAHAPKIFHCPLAFAPDASETDLRKKKRYFSTLSGLTQHLESGACQGGLVTFRQAIKYVEEQLKVLGFGGVRLLKG